MVSHPPLPREEGIGEEIRKTPEQKAAKAKLRAAKKAEYEEKKAKKKADRVAREGGAVAAAALALAEEKHRITQSALEKAAEVATILVASAAENEEKKRKELLRTNDIESNCHLLIFDPSSPLPKRLWWLSDVRVEQDTNAMKGQPYARSTALSFVEPRAAPSADSNHGVPVLSLVYLNRHKELGIHSLTTPCHHNTASQSVQQLLVHYHHLIDQLLYNFIVRLDNVLAPSVSTSVSSSSTSKSGSVSVDEKTARVARLLEAESKSTEVSLFTMLYGRATEEAANAKRVLAKASAASASEEAVSVDMTSHESVCSNMMISHGYQTRVSEIILTENANFLITTPHHLIAIIHSHALCHHTNSVIIDIEIG
jgi:hypothetical protein